MKINKIINEIAYASATQPMVEIDLDLAEQAGDIDGEIVWKFSQGPDTVYFLKIHNRIAAYIVLGNEINGYYHLQRMENLTKLKGSITALVIFVTSKLHLKLIIPNTEPLTYFGLTWLYKLIKGRGRGLKLSDQSGNFPDEKMITAEWYRAQEDFVNGSVTNGPTAIFIENKNILKQPMFESQDTHRLIRPYIMYLGDLELE